MALGEFKQKFFKNILVYGSYTYSANLVNFFSFTILSRLLVPSQYGFVALITVFTGFVSIFSDAGLSFAVIRSDYGYTYHRALHNLTITSGIILFVLVAALAYPISLFYHDTRLIAPTLVLSLLFIIKAITIVPQAILNKKLAFGFTGRAQLIVSISTAICSIMLAYLHFGFWALILPQIFSAVLLYFMLNNRVKMPLVPYKINYVMVAFRKVKWLMKNLIGFNLINYWARNADNLLIGKVYGSAPLGIYSKSYSLLTLPLGIISGLFGTILFPSLKALKQKGGDVRSEYASVLGLISLLNFPIGVVLLLFAEPLVDILWGVKWKPAAEFVPYFGLLIFTQSLISTAGNIFILLEKDRTFFWMGSFSSAMLVLSIVVGAQFSVLHIARFYTLGALVLNVPIVLYIGFIKTFHFSWPYMLRFWLPKLSISIGLLVALWLKVAWVNLLVLLLLYFIHLVFEQKKEISKGLLFLKDKINK